MLTDGRGPLYYQIAHVLTEQILLGQYKIGEYIPSEERLCQEFNVSRITVRRAVEHLVNLGMLIRKQGKGTFVSGEGLDGNRINPMMLTGSLNAATAIVESSDILVLRNEDIMAAAEIAAELLIQPGTRISVIERVRIIGGEPFSLMCAYMPLSIGRLVRQGDLEHYSVLKILRDFPDIVISRGIQTIHAVAADERQAACLKVEAGSPLLKIERVIFDGYDRPIELIYIYYPGDRHEIAVELI